MLLLLPASCGVRSGAGSRDHVVALAAIGPMSGPAALRGRDLAQAAQMAVDEANRSGESGSRTVRLTVYDDRDEPARAQALAGQIAATDAVAVLGGVGSSAAAAAGRVYSSRRIPAITGAASEARVTAGNDWYFRLFRDAGGQGRFMADYARYATEARSIIVLRETGTAGDEYAAALRDRAGDDGIRVLKDEALTPGQIRDATVLQQTADGLAGLPRPDIFVLGVQYAEMPAVLRALHNRLGPFRAMSYSSLGNNELGALFRTAEQQRHLPRGTYTEGLTVAAPQLPDVAEYAQTVFAARYAARYGAAPTPEAVRWYEAARLIVDAAALAPGDDAVSTPAARSAIRERLASLNGPDTAATGIAGPIYFDSDRNAVRGISIGVFHDGRLISAPTQLIPVTDTDEVPGWDALTAAGRTVEIDGKSFVKVPVVYAGLELNSLDDIDTHADTFGADFFLWLRCADTFNPDPRAIEFPSAVSGAGLGAEMDRRGRGGFTTVAYHIKGEFRGNYEFSRFPFDEQVLHIPVQFRDSNSFTVLLAAGNTGSGILSNRRGSSDSSAFRDPGDNVSNSVAPVTPVLSSKLWREKSDIVYRDVLSYGSEGGEASSAFGPSSIQVNRINTAITIRRNVAGFAVKNFLPLVCVLVAVLIGYALASNVIDSRASIGVTALLTTCVLYQKLAGDLPTVTYVTAMDYVFFAFFGICAVYLFLAVVTYELHKEQKHRFSRLLNQLGAGFSIGGLALTLLFVWILFWRSA